MRIDNSLRAAVAWVAASTITTSAIAAPLDWNAVRTSLAAIPIADCGQPAPKYVDLILAPTGEITDVKAEPGAWSEKTVACIEGRFAKAKLAPFDGSTQSIRFLLLPAPLPAPQQPSVVYVDGPASLPYDDERPIPYGYHLEDRHRKALLITGGALAGAGLLLIVAGAASGGGCRTGEYCMDMSPVVVALGVIVGLTGTGLFLGGLPTHKVLVRDPAPVASQAFGGSLGLRF